MFPRRPFLLPGLLAAVVLVLAGALVYWTTRGDGGDVQVQELVEASGPDVGPDAPDALSNAVIPPEPEKPLITPEWLEALHQSTQAAMRAAEREAEERETAAAVAAARVQDQSVAAAAVRSWGSGQLLLSMPSIGVTAAVSGMGYEGDGRTPATPSTPWGVGLYSFTDYPGTGGNAVFSGHVDWYTGAPAVFGRLGSVRVGDPIYIVLANGTPITYQVASSYYVSPYTANVGEIFGATASEAVTFITCGGAWDPVAKDYSHRLIVRAYRIR